MAFLLENTLGNDISKLIFEYTKPKNIHEYRDKLCWFQLEHAELIKKIMTETNIDYNYEDISKSYVLSKNMRRFSTYKFYIGNIDLNPLHSGGEYSNVIGTISLYLEFDSSSGTVESIILLDDTGNIINKFKLQDSFALCGVFSKFHRFHFNIVNKSKLNTQELTHWNLLIKNSTDLVNTLLEKQNNNELDILSRTYL